MAAIGAAGAFVVTGSAPLALAAGVLGWMMEPGGEAGMVANFAGGGDDFSGGDNYY